MKKMIAVMLVCLVFGGILAGCQQGECELCGEEGRVYDATIMGESCEICGDCKEEIQDLQASFR